MVNPLSKFLKEDIKEFKVHYRHKFSTNTWQNQRKDFYRVQERFEELVARNAAQSKTKDPNLLRDVYPCSPFLPS